MPRHRPCRQTRTQRLENRHDDTACICAFRHRPAVRSMAMPERYRHGRSTSPPVPAMRGNETVYPDAFRPLHGRYIGNNAVHPGYRQPAWPVLQRDASERPRLLLDNRLAIAAPPRQRPRQDSTAGALSGKLAIQYPPGCQTGLAARRHVQSHRRAGAMAAQPHTVGYCRRPLVGKGNSFAGRTGRTHVRCRRPRPCQHIHQRSHTLRQRLQEPYPCRQAG